MLQEIGGYPGADAILHVEPAADPGQRALVGERKPSERLIALGEDLRHDQHDATPPRDSTGQVAERFRFDRPGGLSDGQDHFTAFGRLGGEPPPAARP
ncbi:MAG TPA: hypothetical protein VMY37_06110 [Thermoguttaceae bacterium]|nr:hypothetical protein [Thermoguttaceae bacterium]